MPGHAYCTSCGAPLDAVGSSCGRCGAVRAPAEPIEQITHTVHTVQRVGSVAARASTVVSLTGGLPWATVRGAQTPDVGELVRRAAPALASTVPRPNLRRPALSIAVALACDLGIALLRVGTTSWPLLAMRLATGTSTALLGVATGPTGGRLRRLTGLASVMFAAVQLVSMIAGIRDASRSAAGLATVAPPIVAVASGLLLSIVATIGAWRR